MPWHDWQPNSFSRRGSNVVSTLSCNSPNWPPENTFANMIDMTKSMCGTSFGAILRHPRCAEVNKEKISREMIDRLVSIFAVQGKPDRYYKRLHYIFFKCRFKEDYKKLSENERNSIAVENQKYLKEFDTEASLMEFHHLPQKSTKMEFTLVSESHYDRSCINMEFFVKSPFPVKFQVSDLTQDEILDYAIISGNSCDDLVIQSFINFNYQVDKTSHERWYNFSSCFNYCEFIKSRNSLPFAWSPFCATLCRASFGQAVKSLWANRSFWRVSRP